MNPERYQQVKQIFAAVIACDTGERSDLLAHACAGDEDLRAEVESLLEHDKPAAEFIEESAFEVTARMLAETETESIKEQRLGAYKILSEVGRGGMGVVYLAARDDEQFTKRVAIKLIKRGMDTDAVLRRFLSERQILAQLEHLNIARLLDGGTTEDGLPYFVMEYVEGTNVIGYCDEHKLSTDERLKLFRQICSAIQYAHQNLVIHRDIKPANILVTEEGVPKLLDFGIAKLLHSDTSQPQTEMTTAALRVMTPEYASPEQIRAEKITTATDVYSLGVVLYELLTGHRPYRLKSHRPDEIARAICDDEPERPSTAVSRVEELPSSDSTAPVSITPESVSATREGYPEKLRHRLSGDLDNIVLMALRKDPQRRYESAAQLSADIQRHLDGMPVIARKDTFGYRSGKFINRHRVGVLAAALVLVTLLSGIAMTMRQKRKAERRFNDVRELANSFVFEINGAIEDLPGSTPARVLLVKRALTYLDSLAQEAGDDRLLQLELAKAYLKVGDIQGRPYRPNIGDTAGALVSYRKAQAILNNLAQAEPKNLEVLFVSSFAYEDIGRVQMREHDQAGALENERKAVGAGEQLVAAAPANAQYRKLLGDTYVHLGMAMYGDESSQSIENLRQTLEVFRKALSVHEPLAAAAPAEGKYEWAVGADYEFIGYTLRNIGDSTGDPADYRRAVENHYKELEINQALLASDQTNASYRDLVGVAHMDVGNSHMKLGEAGRALEHFRQLQSISESLAASDPTNVEARRGVANSYQYIGNALGQAGDVAGALDSSRKALTSFAELVAADPTNSENRISLIEVNEQIGSLLEKVGNTAGALESYRRALTVLETWPAAESANISVSRLKALDYRNIGKTYATTAADSKSTANKRQDSWHEARSWYQRSLDTWQNLRAQGSLNSKDENYYKEVIKEIERCDAELGKP